MVCFGTGIEWFKYIFTITYMGDNICYMSLLAILLLGCNNKYPCVTIHRFFKCLVFHMSRNTWDLSYLNMEACEVLLEICFHFSIIWISNKIYHCSETHMFISICVCCVWWFIFSYLSLFINIVFAGRDSNRWYQS
jgi:hypothetical protein